jgi:hypothetical protein
MRQWVSRILAVLMLMPALGLVALDPASAGPCHWGTYVTGFNEVGVTYGQKWVCPPGVTPPSDPPAGGKGSAAGTPSCDVASAPRATFCRGSSPCYYGELNPAPPWSEPATAPPVPGAKWHVRFCYLRAGVAPGQAWVLEFIPTVVWVGQAEPPPPLVDQAREAFGQLVVPKASLVFNPTGWTLVNVDTWFWAQGLSGAELRGTSAFGLVAVATPDKLVVTPGDGSAPLVCSWVTVKSDACAYPYRRSSVGGSVRGTSGGPAYEATGKATWRVRFEQDGAPVPIEGAPTVLTGPGMTTPVEVTEVQTIVTGAS